MKKTTLPEPIQRMLKETAKQSKSLQTKVFYVEKWLETKGFTLL